MGPETRGGGLPPSHGILCLVRQNLARYLCSGPRWGFRSGHSELPMVAGLRPNLSIFVDRAILRGAFKGSASDSPIEIY
ncbi:hypothetical protein NDU88_003134 [Pleurodeles waltl]|uniref:Uncharacterized protein n=1 Tax=Pleurodeles waltl TaxID=8319 RepID=A0AAV7WRJ0_PLEWA|nr:hypothetical protein NDU88_003134 [Pleurodeles waltl]